jgi:hypothetical protein
MTYRDDLDAAHARVTALEQEVATLRARPQEDPQARTEVVALRTENWELQSDLARARAEAQRHVVVTPLPPRRGDRAIAELEDENAALREALRTSASALAKVNDTRPAAPRQPGGGAAGTLVVLLVIAAIAALAVAPAMGGVLAAAGVIGAVAAAASRREPTKAPTRPRN